MRETERCVLTIILTLALIGGVFPVTMPVMAAADGWAPITDGRTIKAYSSLRNYEWQKNAIMPPNGQYDRIALHRLVKTGTAPKGAVFIHWGYAGFANAETIISNPPSDNWTKTEVNVQAFYWANRGFDVYAMDYRNHFVPDTLNASQVSFMADWGYDQMVSDMKEGVNKAKEISGFSKIFMVSIGNGAESVLNYATLYGKEDLGGMVLLDPALGSPRGPVVAKRGGETNTYNLTQQIDSVKANKTWATDGYYAKTRLSYAFFNPGASAYSLPLNPPAPNSTNPLTNKTWTNVTEYIAYTHHYSSNGVGYWTNFYGGIGNVTQLEMQFLKNDKWIPTRYSLESAAMVNWVNCPYLKYDYDDHYAEIDVPVLAISAGGTSNRTGKFQFVNGLGTSDFTGIVLSQYGFYDMTTGIYSARDISQPALDWMINHSTAGWTLVTDARTMKAYPDLREYIWQKNASTPPNGPYDKIALHRLVKTGITTKGVVFICPRVAWSGEAWISNPPTDNWTRTENNSQPIYWANRGFDVYAIDYRTHFVPSTLNSSKLAFMQNWTYNLWVTDVKEAVEKTKEMSGAGKVFMTGPSNGGGIALMYATKYWKEDLKGIVLLDPLIYNGRTAIVAKNTTGTNTFNLTSGMIKANASGWGQPAFTAQQISRAKYVLANPGGPAEDPPGTPLTPTINPRTNRTWANITEWYANLVTTGGGANANEGYANVTEYAIHALASEPFNSVRMSLESIAMADWTNCPYVPYDYDDHFNEINVPLLAFASGPLYSNKTGTFQFVNGINNTDFTGIMLPKYGHTDVYMGTYSARDVSEPAYQWMLSHLSTLDVNAFSSVTVMPGWIWNFFVHNRGGSPSYTYQWYEGLDPLQGQTRMVLSISKTTPGVYSFYCRVTDRDGITTTSNVVTLTVIS